EGLAFDGGDDFFYCDGFGEVGGEAGLRAAAAIRFLAISGDGDETRVRLEGAQPRRELVAVHHRQPEIEEGDLGWLDLGQAQRLEGVVGDGDAIAELRQQLAGQRDRVDVVV